MTSTQIQHQVMQGNPTLGTSTVVRPETDSRLDQLAAEYAALEPLAKQYAARLKEITDGIKAELATAAPGETEVLLASTYLAKPLQLQAVESWRLDSKALKAAQPQTWVTYAKKSTSWRLAPVAG